MAESLSIPIETLILQLGLRPESDRADGNTPRGPLADRAHCDVLIVGSGYGGAIAAARFAGARDRQGEPLRVLLLERGREYAPGDFPESLGDLPGHIGILGEGSDRTAGYHDGLFDLRLGAGQSILVGNGLGGGSLINAGVALRPSAAVLSDPAWPQRLRADAHGLAEAFDRVTALLGATSSPDHPPSSKYDALARVATALGVPCQAAPITVQRSPGLNPSGVVQPACTSCGQCVTGCNVGAKRTLSSTALPLASQRGAVLCTGATVLTVSARTAGAARWVVRFRRTASERTPMIEEVFTLNARVVVLAAGTLGSCEILLRSDRAGLLSCSEMLGRRFGGNGDVIAATYGQARPVHAVARGASDAPPVAVGPTITGWLRLLDPEGRTLTIEDGAIPWSLARFFGEIVTTGSLLRRFTDDRLSTWSHTRPEVDPAAVHPDAIDRSQVFLMMRSGSASGVLDLISRDSPCVADPASLRELDRRRIAVALRCAHDGRTATVVDRLLAGLETPEVSPTDAFDGGQYLANPLWRALPAGFDELPGLAAAPGALFTVHPLGGCVMADDAGAGVVDDAGAVFDADDDRRDHVHRGLYVLDGSIVPMALGSNPLLTIAALAWRGCTKIAEREGWHALDGAGPAWRPALPRWPQMLNQAAALGSGAARTGAADEGTGAPPRTVAIDIEERLTSVVDPVPAPLRPVLGHECALLVLRVVIRIDDVDEWLADTGRELPARCELLGCALDADRRRRINDSTTAVGERDDLIALAKGWGSVRLLRRDPSSHAAGEDLRRLRALAAFLGRRGPELPRMLFRRGQERGAGDIIAGFWRVAGVHALSRTMDYTLDLYPATGQLPWGMMRLAGRKQIGYAPGRGDPWTALSRLPSSLVAIAGAASRTPERAIGIDWTVDLADMSQRFFAQVRRSPDTAESAGAMISLGSMFARSLLAAHFWSFAGLDYPNKPITRVSSLAGPQRLGHRRIAPQLTYFSAPLRAGSAPRIELRLTRFARLRAEPVLLVHGLAHSSRLFHTRTVRPNLVESLLEAGFDVWLLDHRLSIDLPFASYLPGDMDTIARFDIAQAVDIVHQSTGQPVHLVAHCVGAAAAAMSVLGGHCHVGGAAAGGPSKLRSIVMHAFTPWVEPSIPNRIRANLAGYVKDLLRIPGFPAVLPDAPRAYDQLIDRFASSLPLARGADQHVRNRSRRAREIRNRMTLFYGTEYTHDNLSPATHRDIVDFSGFGNLAAFRQIHQCARQGRLVDRHGRDVYLDASRFERFWPMPTLFCAGIDNRVFSHLGARRSARNLEHIRSRSDGGAHWGVYLFEPPGTGHLDFMMGRHAASRPTPPDSIHATLARFLHDPASIAGHPDVLHGRALEALPVAADPACPALRVGPVLRGARPRGRGAVEIDIWLELDDRAPLAPAIEFVRQRDQCVLEPVRLQRMSATYGRYLRARVLLTEFDDLVVRLRYRGVRDGADELRDHRLNLTGLAWFRRLWADDPEPGASFAVGSCLHGGAPFERDLADGAFALMRRHLRAGRDGPPLDHLLLVGDQIYADATAGVFGDGQDDLARYVERYRRAFSQPSFASILGQVPTHFALDDHEFVNNWPGQAPPGHPLWRNDGYQRDIAQFRRARRYAVAYQGTALPSRAPDLDRQVFWQDFVSGGCPFFVMDTRTERTLRSGGEPPASWSMIGDAQRDAFESWVRRWAGHPVPLFVVAGSPLVPIALELYEHPELAINADGWMGYPADVEWFARQVLALPGRFVLIAGDLHLSAAAEMTFRCAERAGSAVAIVASGLFSPWPFANADPASFAWRPARGLRLPGTTTSCDYRATLLSTQPRQFTRIDARPLGVAGEPPAGATAGPLRRAAGRTTRAEKADASLREQCSVRWSTRSITGWEIGVRTFSAPMAPEPDRGTTREPVEAGDDADHTTQTSPSRQNEI